jgi:hypothetical protein
MRIMALSSRILRDLREDDIVHVDDDTTTEDTEQ